MFISFTKSLALATLMETLGVRTAEKLERKLAGGRAISVRGLIAYRTTMAALLHQMKMDRSKKRQRLRQLP
jgi:antitoxin component of MazEF toxin-antitoxin module